MHHTYIAGIEPAHVIISCYRYIIDEIYFFRGLRLEYDVSRRFISSSPPPGYRKSSANTISLCWGMTAFSCADGCQSFRSCLSSALLLSLTSYRGVRRITLPDLATCSLACLMLLSLLTNLLASVRPIVLRRVAPGVLFVRSSFSILIRHRNV